MISAQLSYDNLVLWIGAKQCQRQADIIIVVLWRLTDAVMLTEDVVSDLPGHCFAHRAGYGHHLEAAPLAVRSGKITQSRYGVINLENRVTWPVTRESIFVYHCADSTFSKSIDNIIVAIEFFARDGKEAVAGFCSPRVDAYTGEKVTRDLWLVARTEFDMRSYYPR